VAWIRTIEESEATGGVKEHYDELKKEWGFIPNIRKVHSIKPELMRELLSFTHVVTRGGTSLGRVREEMLAVTISALLKCKY